jgi:hypothetical protein
VANFNKNKIKNSLLNRFSSNRHKFKISSKIYFKNRLNKRLI